MMRCLQIKEFCKDEVTCRHAALMRYFGEEPSGVLFPGGRCGGGCDACAAAAGAPPQPGDWQPLVGLRIDMATYIHRSCK